MAIIKIERGLGTSPQVLTRIEFVRLCMSAGGMTADMLVQAKGAPDLAALWIILDMAQEVQKTDQEIQPGLQLLHQLGFLPNGADAVLTEWPVA